VSLIRRGLGHVAVEECPRCEGVWAGRKVLDEILQDLALFEEVRAAYPKAAVGHDPEVTYLKCPRCHDLMNRRLFAPGAKVIVDVCRGHGTWFDAAELRAVVDFVELRGLTEPERQAYDQRAAARAEAAYLMVKYKAAIEEDQEALVVRFLRALLGMRR
jgi:Zn-finger nucleic acid-binding protein